MYADGARSTYKIDRYSQRGQDRLLCEKTLHIWWRERVCLWMCHIVPASTRLNIVLVDFEGVHAFTFGAHSTADFGEVLFLTVEKHWATVLEGVLACCNLDFAAIWPCPVV